MRTPEQLKGFIRNKALEMQITSQELLQIFMFERLIERLSLSEYRSNIVLKGGLLIGSIIGISERTTMDMDTTIIGYPVNEESVIGMFKEIIGIEMNDGISFSYIGISQIRKKEEYRNYTVSIEAIYGKIKVPFKN